MGIYKTVPFQFICNSFIIADGGKNELNLSLTDDGELYFKRAMEENGEEEETGGSYEAIDFCLDYDEVIRLKNFLDFALIPCKEIESDLFLED